MGWKKRLFGDPKRRRGAEHEIEEAKQGLGNAFRLLRGQTPPTTKICPFCTSKIDYRETVCPVCGKEQPLS